MTDNLIFHVKIAGLTVEMRSRYACTKEFCSDYLTDGENVDLIAAVSESEIDAEGGLYDSPHSREYCESICLYRAIAERLPSYHRFVFHGAAVEADGKAYLFAAPSGTGKSTHVGLWMKHFGDRVSIINGDKPIIGVEEGAATVYSGPWAGKEGWQRNTQAPIGGICLLARGKENRIQRIDPSAYFDELIRQIYVPKNGEAMLQTLDLLNELAKQVPFYRLECDVSENAAVTSFQMMVEGK